MKRPRERSKENALSHVRLCSFYFPSNLMTGGNAARYRVIDGVTHVTTIDIVYYNNARQPGDNECHVIHSVGTIA